MTPAERSRLIAELTPLCTATLPGSQDVRAMNARIERMQLLYQATGRDNPGHTLHGRFTGLHMDSMTEAPF